MISIRDLFDRWGFAPQSDIKQAVAELATSAKRPRHTIWRLGLGFSSAPNAAISTRSPLARPSIFGGLVAALTWKVASPLVMAKLNMNETAKTPTEDPPKKDDEDKGEGH